MLLYPYQAKAYFNKHIVSGADQIKILFITRTYPPIYGGMENFSFGLYSALARNASVKLIANPFGKIFLPIFSLQAFFYTLFMGWKYDVIYCSDILTCVYVALPKLIWRKKMVTTLYGLDINFMYQKNTGFMGFLQVLYRLIVMPTRYIVDAFLPISEGTAEISAKINVENHSIITPGIDVEGVKVSSSAKSKLLEKIKSKYEIPAEKKVLFHIGRSVRRKGMLWFVQNVMPKVKDRFHLLLAGGGPDIELIEDQITKLDLGDSVNLLGRVSDEEKEKLMKGADLFVMPNIVVKGDREGFGIVAIEASLGGTPVVAARIEGITSAVIDGKTGVFFESENAKDCIKKLDYAIKRGFDPEKVSEYTKQHYSWNNIADQYLKVFTEIIKSE